MEMNSKGNFQLQIFFPKRCEVMTAVTRPYLCVQLNWPFLIDCLSVLVCGVEYTQQVEETTAAPL